MVKGIGITTKIINQTLAEGVETVLISKNCLNAIEKWRDYINKNYLFVELYLPHIEDIFIQLYVTNYVDLLDNKLIKDMISKIEEGTNCKGLFIKVLDFLRNNNFIITRPVF